MARRRGRPTATLLSLASERFHGCEECWEDNAYWWLEDVLKPLRLRVNERKRLMRVLACPRCDSPLRDFHYDRVVGYEANEIRDARRLSQARRRHRDSLTAFHSFLLKYPTLGGLHPVGQQLTKIVKRAKKRTLEPGVWYRARRDEGEVRTADDFMPPDPQQHQLSAGRFNSAGQLGYYLAQASELAAIEVTGERDTTKRVWIAEVKVQQPLRVLDLTIQIFGTIHQQPLVITGLVYSGALSDYGEDRSLPQYRVPQFIADILRCQKVDAIVYTRRRDSGFPNPEAWGTNLVILRSDKLQLEIAAPKQFTWRQVPFSLVTGGGVLLQEVND